MTPQLRIHLITAALFVGVMAVLGLLWVLRDVFVYVLLAAVGGLVYYGLYVLVSARLRARANGASESADPGTGANSR